MCVQLLAAVAALILRSALSEFAVITASDTYGHALATLQLVGI